MFHGDLDTVVITRPNAPQLIHHNNNNWPSVLIFCIHGSSLSLLTVSGQNSVLFRDVFTSPYATLIKLYQKFTLAKAKSVVTTSSPLVASLVCLSLVYLLNYSFTNRILFSLIIIVQHGNATTRFSVIMYVYFITL